ncbi:MAG: hypothetical protein JWO89_2029, partial [Verrucomicrobiaceae bacterium]|nr:hypothetical protein [Verrucomicrobiaceae bacterium]
MRPIMHPRNAKPSVIFVVLLAVAVGTASWLGFHNGSPEQLVQSTQTFAQGGPVDATTTNKATKTGQSAIAAQNTAAVEPKVPSGKRLFTAPVWRQAELPPATPESSYASRAILATATLDVQTMPMLKELHKGDHVVLPLGAGAEVEGVVNLVVPQDSGWVQVAGGLVGDKKGSFMLSQSLSDSKVWGGQIVREDKHVGYVISTANGRVKIDKKPLNAIMCESLPAAQAQAAAVDTTAPVASPEVQPDADGADAAVAIFDSRPGARGVLYLDFDGETVTDTKWNGGVTVFAAPAVVAGAAITAAQIADICKRVAEDFSPYNVTVTNDPSLYAAAPVGERMHCIITPTSAWYPTSVGGITFTGSYRGPAGGAFSSTIPCWVFNSSSTSTIALTCSHELGHALGLSHDGTAGASYYAGHDTGATSWGPIMGAPYGKAVTQWNNGTYPGANNNEDDLIVLENTVAQAGFMLGFVADEAGGTSGSAAMLATTSPVTKTGLVNLSGEQDWYQFSSLGGPISFSLTPAAVDPDVDTLLQLYGPAGVAAGPGGAPPPADLLATSAISPSSLSSTLSFNIPSTVNGGPFYLAISGKGRAPVAASSSKPAVIGYSSYGSVGTYTLTGNYVPVPASPTITVQPTPVTNANQGTKVTLSVTVVSNSPVTYKWKKNGVDMPGKTAGTLVFTSVQIADDATYTVEVKNGAAMNNTKLSDPAVLNVYHKPAIVAKLTPSPSTVVAGNNATFAVTVTDPGKDGPNVTNYVWKKNNVVIPVGTNASAGTATLTLPTVDFYAGGSYTCTVSNTIGFATSTAAILTVTSPPLFKVDLPAVKHIANGSTFTATVTVVGTAPFTYKWFKDGTVIAGATKSTYAMKSTAPGTYWVEATGNATATSTHMVVDAQDKPAIALVGQPAAATTLNAGDTLSLSVAATGTSTLLYQWQFNTVNLVDGGAITGATSDHLVVNPAAFINQGTYRCIVTNAVGTVTSKNAVVTVKSPPVIVTQPLPIKIAIGGTGVLKVGAIGTPTLRYLWVKDTGSGFVTVPGGTGPTLTLARATATATAPATPTEGDYKVTVT